MVKKGIFNFSQEEREFWRELRIIIPKNKDWKSHIENDLKKDFEKYRFKKEEISTLAKSLDFGIQGNVELDSLFKDKKKAVILYCLHKLFQENSKAISRYFGLREKGGHIQKRTSFIKLVGASVDKEFLKGLLYYSDWLRSGALEIKCHFENLDENSVQLISKKIRYQMGLLSKREPIDRRYHYKCHAKLGELDFFIILRGKTDAYEPGYPKNRRRINSAIKMMIIDKHNKTLHLVLHTKKERRILRAFLANKIDLVSAFPRDVPIISKENFAKLMDKSSSKDIKLTGIYFNKSELPGAVSISLQDPNKKADIKPALDVLIKEGKINAVCFKDNGSLSILYKKYPLRIKLVRILGYYELILREKGIQIGDRKQIYSDFESSYGIPLNSFFGIEGETPEQVEICNYILNRNDIDLDKNPLIVRETLSDLISKRILEEPVKDAKRHCTNSACNNYFATVWRGGDCVKCGGRMQLDGSVLHIQVDGVGFRHYISNVARREGLRTKTIRKQIKNKKFKFIYVVDENNDKLSIYPCSLKKVDEEVVEYFEQNCFPLLIISSAKTCELGSIEGRQLEIIDLPSIFVKFESDSYSPLIKEALKSQKIKSLEKILAQARASAKRLKEQPMKYNDSLFETDTFNILHEIFLNADRLGTKLSGTSIPDGIASIQFGRKGDKRYCFSWDCKFSSTDDGYKLNENDSNIQREYIKKLLKNDLVKLYGGLGVYLIITNNMDKSKFGDFAKKVRKWLRWDGKLGLLFSNDLLSLHNLYSENRKVFADNTNIEKLFLSKFHKLFFGSGKSKFVVVEKKDIDGLICEIQVELQKLPQPLEFSHKDVV